MFAVDLPGGDREFTETQIADQLSKGKIGPDTLVWREGMSEWLEIRKVPELARHMKKTAAKPAVGETPAVPKAAPAAAAPTASSPSSPGRFRPRQPTLPMGMLPDAIQATLPQVRPIETPAAPPAPTPAAPATPAAPVVAAPAAPASGPTPLPRLPAVPAARAAAPPPADSKDKDGPAGFAARERAAALLKPPPERKETPRVGSVRAQLPIVPMPEQILDEEPTILRPSPFSELDTTPAPRAPLPTPVRDLLARQGQGEAPSAPRAAPSERKPPSPPPAPPSRPAAPPAPLERTPTPHIDTYRATPEAKRSWFPEPGSDPPPPAPPELSSPFPIGATRPAPPSAPFTAPIPSAAQAAPRLPYRAPNPVMAAPTSPISFDEVAALRGQRKRTMWIVVAVIAVLVIGVVVAVLSGGSEKLPPPAPAPEPHAAMPAATSEVTTAQPPSGSNPPPSEAEPSPPSGAPLPGAPGANAPGGFAEMFAQGAKQAGAPGAGSGHFDPGAAKSALDALLTEAARCREPGGPQGIARVAVTFAPNGGVSSATIAEPPFAGSSVGNCICEAMKRARIKPFSGPPGNLTERVSIR